MRLVMWPFCWIVIWPGRRGMVGPYMLVVREGQVIFVRSIDAVVGASFSASPVTPAGSDGPAGVQLCRRGLQATTTYSTTVYSDSIVYSVGAAGIGH